MATERKGEDKRGRQHTDAEDGGEGLAVVEERAAGDHLPQRGPQGPDIWGKMQHESARVGAWKEGRGHAA